VLAEEYFLGTREGLLKKLEKAFSRCRWVVDKGKGGLVIELQQVHFAPMAAVVIVVPFTDSQIHTINGLFACLTNKRPQYLQKYFLVKFYPQNLKIMLVKKIFYSLYSCVTNYVLQSGRMSSSGRILFYPGNVVVLICENNRWVMLWKLIQNQWKIKVLHTKLHWSWIYIEKGKNERCKMIRDVSTMLSSSVQWSVKSLHCL